MTDPKEAIKQLLEKAIAAYALKQEQQAMALLHEVLDNIKLAYGEADVRSILFSMVTGMPLETQATCVEMLEQEALDRFDKELSRKSDGA